MVDGSGLGAYEFGGGPGFDGSELEDAREEAGSGEKDSGLHFLSIERAGFSSTDSEIGVENFPFGEGAYVTCVTSDGHVRLPLQPHDFDSLPEGFEYEHYISSTSNTSASDAGVGNRDLESCVGGQEGYVQV